MNSFAISNSNLIQSLTIGQGLKVWGNFSKICIGIIKIMSNYGENFIGMQSFHFHMNAKFRFLRGLREKISVIIDLSYNWKSGIDPQTQEKRKFCFGFHLKFPENYMKNLYFVR